MPLSTWTPEIVRPPLPVIDGALARMRREERARWRHIRDPRLEPRIRQKLGAAFVQEKDSGVDFSGSTTLSVTLTVTAGNLLAIWIANGTQTITISSVAGNSNTYTPVDGPVDEATTIRGWTYYAKNINGGSTTVTVTFSAAPSASRLLVHEISGCDTTAPLDQHIINAQTNGGGSGTANSYTSTSKTTTTDGQYVFGAHVNDNSDTVDAGTGYALRTPTTANYDPMSEDQVQTTHGSIAVTFSPHAGAAQFNGSLTAMMTFKAASSGPTVAQEIPGFVQELSGAMIGQSWN